MGTNKNIAPEQYFIVPDPKIESSLISNVSAQGGLIHGMATPATTNKGTFSAFTGGVLPAALNYDVRIQDSGGVYETQFAWKINGEADTLYRGEQDRRYQTDIQNPFGGLISIGFSATGGYCKKTNNEIVMVVSSTVQNALEVRYRTCSDNSINPNSWTTQRIELRTDAYNYRTVYDSGASASTSSSIAMTETADGGLLLAVKNDLKDIDIYQSDDGIAWTLIATDIVDRFSDFNTYNTPNDIIRNMRIAQSGQWTRIVFVSWIIAIDQSIPEGTENQVSKTVFMGLVSTDQGKSWDSVNIPSPNSTLIPNFARVYHYNDSQGDNCFDLCGSGDESGTFVLVGIDPATNTLDTWIASGSSDFNYYSEMRKIYGLGCEHPHTNPRPYLAKYEDWIVCLLDGNIISASATIPNYPVTAGFSLADYPNKEIVVAVPEFSQWGMVWNNVSTYYGMPVSEQNMFYLNKKDPLAGQKWTDLGAYPNEVEKNLSYPSNPSTAGWWMYPESSISGFMGTRKYRFTWGRLFETNGFLTFFSGLTDCFSTSWAGLLPQCVYMKYGGWDTRPKSDYSETWANQSLAPMNRHYQTWRRNLIEWISYIGRPAGALHASPAKYQIWKQDRTGSPTTNWDVERLRISASGSTNGFIYSFKDPSSDWGGSLSRTSPWNWCYSPWVNLNGDDPNGIFPTGATGGSCISWTMKVSANNLTSVNSFTGVRIDGFVCELETKSGTAKACRIDVYVYAEEVQVRGYWNDGTNHGSYATLATITPTGTNPLTEYFEFRLGFSPQHGNDSTRCLLLIRKEGSSTWYSSGLLTPNSGSAPIAQYQNQKIQWGLLASYAPADTNIQSYWKNIGLKPLNDLRTMRLGEGLVTANFKDVVRGKIAASMPLYLAAQTDIIWGGLSAAEGDSFTVVPEYTYKGTNSLYFESPRIQWKADKARNLMSLEVYQNTDSDTQNTFNHDAFAIIGTNAKTVKFSYYRAVGSAKDTKATIDLKRATGRISSVKGRLVNVVWDDYVYDGASPANSALNKQIRPHQLASTSTIKNYVRFTNLNAGLLTNVVKEDTAFIVDDNFGVVGSSDKTQRLQLAGVTMTSWTNDLLFAGATLTYYADRGHTTIADSVSSGSNGYDGFEIEVFGGGSTPTPSYNPEPEGYLYTGTVVVGTSLTLRVPLDWNWKDDAQPNNKMYKSVSNYTWGYKQSGASRKFTGEMVGDVSQQLRRIIRDTLRSATDYNRKPLVFILQDWDYDSEMMLFGRVESGSDLENEGWFWDEISQIWKPLGNLSLTIEEVI